MSTEASGFLRYAVIAAIAVANLCAVRAADPPPTRVERDQALDLELNGFRSPISRPGELAVSASWPLYKEEPKAAQQNFQPPPPPPPLSEKKTPPPPPPPPPPCNPNSPNWPNCLQQQP